MSKSMKKILIYCLSGGICGILICLMISLFTAGESGEAVSIGTEIFYYVISFIHGAICFGTVFIYEIESWSILRATLTHFFITLTSFYCLGFLQKWLVFGSMAFFIITACFVVSYFIVWIIMFIQYKRMIKKLNKDLNDLKQKEQGNK